MAGSPISVAVSRSGKRPHFLMFTSKKIPSVFYIETLPILICRLFQTEPFPADLLVAFWASHVRHVCELRRDILWTRSAPSPGSLVKFILDPRIQSLWFRESQDFSSPSHPGNLHLKGKNTTFCPQYSVFVWEITESLMLTSNRISPCVVS